MKKENVSIAVACDHAGYELKNELIAVLTKDGYQVTDLGCNGESCHYPVFAKALCQELIAGKAKFGLLVCGTGAGMMMCANKHRGIRAMLASDEFSVEKSRSHNNANVLCLGGRVLSTEKAIELTKLFLSTDFEAGRHRERVEMFDEIL